MSKTATAVVTVANKLGLHARPATLFAEVASGVEADIKVRRCDYGDPVDGKSIMQMMMLAATHGTDIEITAQGNDADKAVQTLDQDERLLLYRQAEEILVEDIPIIPLAYVRSHRLVKPWLKKVLVAPFWIFFKDVILEPH